MTRLAAAAVLALGLAACSSSDDPPPPAPPPVEPGPSAYEAGKAAIMAAATEAAAQAAYDAIDLGEVSGEEAASLRMALNTRLADLATASAYPRGRAAIMAATTAEGAQAAYDAIDKTAITGEQAAALQELLTSQLAMIATAGDEAEQKMALSDAAGDIDLSDLSTQELVNAANAAIAALKAVLAAATDVSDADKAMYEGRVTAAETAVASAQSALDHTAQTMALTNALTALQAIDLTDLSTQAKVDAANDAIVALRSALAAATELSDAEKATAMAELATANRTVMAAQGGVDKASQMMALSAAAAALDMIDLDALMTQAQIDEADAAITALELALAGATDLTDAEKLDATVDVTVAKRKVADARTALASNIEGQRTALMTAASNIDTSDLSTQEKVNAAEAAIAALKAALASATHLSDAYKAVYEAQVSAAETVVASAQSVLDHTAQTMALTTALTALKAIDLADLSDQAKLDAADAAIEALEMALEAATELSAAEKTEAMIELGTARRTVMMAQGRFDSDSQMTALSAAVTALEAIDLDDLMTQEKIDAAQRAIDALDEALAAATNLTEADTLDARLDRRAATRRVMAAQETLNTNVEGQRMALTTAGNALAALDLADLDTQEKIDAAEDAVEALEMALMAATHLSDSEKAMYQTQVDTADETVKTAQTGMDRDERMMTQRNAITSAVTAARDAVEKVNDDATETQVTAADNAIAALKAAIDGADDLPEGDIEVATAQGTLTTLEGLLTAAKNSRTVAMRENERKQNEANAATAAKLYAGIAPPTGDVTSPAATDRAAAYNTEGTDILVSAGLPADTPAAVTLSEDKKTTVADLHGWEGMRYTAEPTGDVGTYEAMVYSNVGEPTMGAKFNSGASTGNVGFDLDTDSTDTVTMTTALNVASRIASPRFTHTAGNYTPTLPDPNPNTESTIPIPGSYYGVAGTYTCTPATGSCTVAKAVEGYTFAAPAAWTFKATDPNARVTEMADTTYASYGWWLHKSEDDSTYIASAFVTDRGTVPPADVSGLVAGSATYRGGAAGKYALRSSTGGTNDAGHFTARATLEADFEENEVTGTIDRFMGADGQSRDWTVELKKSALFNNGSVIGDPTRTGIDLTSAPATEDVAQETVWTIGETAADAAGQWSGALKDTANTPTDTTGVPKVGTGTFYSTFASDGKMVGAFGVNRQ